MDDLLVLVHGLMKLALVVGVMVLVATAPSAATTSGKGSGNSLVQSTSAHVSAQVVDDHDEPYGRTRSRLDDSGTWMDSDDSSPSMNLDGTPMNGDLDLNGHVFGDCGCDFDDSSSVAHSMWD
jgi:hypothetical protein